MRFGRWTVVSYATGLESRWNCVCDCGTQKTVRRCHLVSGESQACGCQRKGHVTHGKSRTPTWQSWKTMKYRCQDPNSNEYHRYGARGISVCERWQKFENFLSDMGERPPGTTLDRIDSRGNYEPGNCRWADKYVQANNRSNSRKLHIGPVSKTLADWVRSAGVKYSLVQGRMMRGWDLKKSLNTPPLK